VVQPEIDLIHATVALGVLEGSVSAVCNRLMKMTLRDMSAAVVMTEASNDLAFVSKHRRFTMDKIYRAEEDFVRRRAKTKQQALLPHRKTKPRIAPPRRPN
jgi:hypothetical protein